MTCPDTECHENVIELKKSIKCLPKKVGRAELWGGICVALALSIPVCFTYTSSINKRLLETEKSIIVLQEQQRRIETTVYQAVKDAIRDVKNGE